MQAQKKASNEVARPGGPPRKFGKHRAGCECKFCEKLRKQLDGAAEKERRTGKKVRRRLKVGPKRFIRAIAEKGSPAYGNATAAAVLAGYSALSAESTGAELLRDSRVQTGILAAQNRQGITDDYLAKKLKEGLNAKVVELAKFEGEITDERYYPDQATRHKFLETAHRLRGDFPRNEDGPQTALVINVGDNPARIEGWSETVEGEEARARTLSIGLAPSAALPAPADAAKPPEKS